MLGRRRLVQPQRVLHHSIARQLARKALRGQQAVHCLERNLQWAQAERCMRPRIHPDVHQLVVIQRHCFIRSLQQTRLRIPRHLIPALPLGIDPDGCAIYRPQRNRPLGNSRQLHLHRAEAAHQHVFQHLLQQRAQRIRLIRFIERPAQRRHPFDCILWYRAMGPYPHLPLHSRNAILDQVDRPSHHRCLGETPQVLRSRLRQHRLSRVIRVQNRRQNLRLSRQYRRLTARTDRTHPAPKLAHISSHTHPPRSFALSALPQRKR